MLRPLAVWIVLATGCAGSPTPTATAHAPRSELIARLCEPLPSRAHECIVSWPASVSVRRRAEAMTVSEAGPLAGSDSPVRAYASCVDRETSAGSVARISVLLLNERPESREALAAALPIAVRWEGETCALDECALPVARLDEDRLVLTRRDYDADEDGQNLARMACGAVRDGAVEARARTVGGDISIRELRSDASGVEVRIRRRGHTSTSRERFDWAELGLRLVDDEIDREAAARAASAARVHGLSELDLANEPTIELQIMARERGLARDPTDERLLDLGELLAHAYVAHPSRTDLGVRAVERLIEARALGRARETLTLLGSLVGPTVEPLPRLALALALSEADVAATAAVVRTRAPDLDAPAAERIARSLLAERGDDALDQSATITLAHATTGLTAIARRERSALVPRAGRSRVTLRGVPAALAIAGGCAEPDTVVVCSDTLEDRAVSRVVTATAGTLTVVGRSSCVAGVSEPAAPAELSHLLGLLTTEALHDADVYVVCGDGMVGIGGTVAGTELVVARVSRRLSPTDLEPMERWLARPFASLDGRVFPPPTLTLPVSEAEVEVALSAARSVPGTRCERAGGAIECTGALADVLARFYASFAAD